jgi:SpoIID/LytB domain protein
MLVQVRLPSADEIVEMTEVSASHRRDVTQVPDRDRIQGVNPSIPTRVARALAAVLVVATVVVSADTASADEGMIVFDGGGWGHGVGMPQWGAQGMAVDGYTHEQILQYWYTGIGFADVSEIAGSVPDPIRVGISYVLIDGKQHLRPFRWLEFRADGGPVSVCRPGEAAESCGLTAQPGETWRYQWFDVDGGFCSVLRDGSTVYSHPTDCTVELHWDDQPNTRVVFPGGDVARTFARGTIAFVGPVTEARTGNINGNYQGWRGFHLNIRVSLEEYLYGVAEVPPSWHPEALKAQVVAARSYAAWRSKAGRSYCSCDIYWDTFDQAYKGWSGGTEGNSELGSVWRGAVDDTAGKVAVYGTTGGQPKVAETFYSASTGGATENVSDIWGSNQATYPYLVTRPDPWSGQYPAATRWSKSLTPSAAAAALGFDEIFDIRIVALRESGSPSDIVVEGLVASVPTERHYTGNQLVGPLGLRSHYIYSITMPGSEGAGGGTPQDLAASIGVHDAATGIFSLYDPDTGGSTSFYYGNPADIPYSGDWNGDGITTLGLYRMSAGYLFLRNSNTQGIADIEIFYGNPGDFPLAGDWNGDGKETIGIYRPSQRKFYLRNSNTQGVADIEFAWGNSGDIPLAGDWDGDGITTVGVYRPSTKMLYLTNGIGGASDIVYHYSGAQSGDRIIVGDWDGDGRDTVGVYRPSTATFYLRNSYTAPNADHIIVFGNPNRTPVSGHWG